MGSGKKIYQIWSEGFHVMEGRSGAMLHGAAEGKTFKEACQMYASTNKDFSELFDPERMTYWGCRLYDNEIEARSTFG